MNYRVILPAAALAMGLGVLYTSTQVKAFGPGGFGDGQNTLIQALASKFGVSTDDVKAVFDRVRAQNQQEMEAKYEDNLNQLVTDGKITEDQKNLILTKHQELQSQREQNRTNEQNLTPEERKTQMDQEKTALERWASDNGIDVKYLMGPGGRGRGHGPGDNDAETVDDSVSQ